MPYFEVFVVPDIVAERERQTEKWGEQDRIPMDWVPILGKEFGSVCRAICDNDPDKYREELIHLIAVGVDMLENFDNGGW